MPYSRTFCRDRIVLNNDFKNRTKLDTIPRGTTLFLAALLASCASRTDSPPAARSLLSVSAAEVSGGCFDPASYGAIPNDGRDDREPAQRAIDAASVSGGDVCFGPGVWDLTRSPPGTYNRFAALSIHAPRVNIRGAGKYATTLKMSGDADRRTAWTIALDPGTDGTTISDLAIDTAETFNQDEQSHAIAIGTGVCAGVLCAARLRT